MSEPLVTVVIPLYNRADLIYSTLQSVLDQSLQNFEVIVVDDGSSDSPGAVIDSLKDQRIRYLRQENTGASAARNRGIDAARGKFIALLDADDRFLPHHLESAISILKTSRNTVVYARIVVDRGSGRTFLKPPRGLRPGEPVSEYLMCDMGFMQTSTVVLPTELAQRVRYLEGLPYGQDIDFAIRLDQAGARFHMLNEPSAIWRDAADPKRISSGSNPDVRLRWLNEIRPMVTERAYLGFIGWRIAKAMAERGSKFSALRQYSKAVFSGCYHPKHAIKVGLQIVFAGPVYRRFSDTYLALRKAAQRS